MFNNPKHTKLKLLIKAPCFAELIFSTIKKNIKHQTNFEHHYLTKYFSMLKIKSVLSKLPQFIINKCIAYSALLAIYQ